MDRIILAILAIAFGILLFLNSSGWLPINWCSTYLDLMDQYWPALLILSGFYLISNKRYKIISQILICLLIFLIGLWFICLFIGHDRYWVI